MLEQYCRRCQSRPPQPNDCCHRQQEQQQRQQQHHNHEQVRKRFVVLLLSSRCSWISRWRRDLLATTKPRFRVGADFTVYGFKLTWLLWSRVHGLALLFWVLLTNVSQEPAGAANELLNRADRQPW